TEYVFALPGVGRLVVDAVFARDYPLVQGVVLLIAIGFILSNLIVDVLYGWIDPRIRSRGARAAGAVRRGRHDLGGVDRAGGAARGALRSARPEPRQHAGGAGARPS